MKTILKQRIANGLIQLGLKSGDAVMMHSSLSSLGPVEGGAEIVIDAILDVIGKEGTIIFPAFVDDLWHGRFGLKECRTCCGKQKFCPSKEPGGQGMIPETLRKRPDVLRGCHPTHSWCVLGIKAEMFLQDNFQAQTPCGKGNPFEALVREDGVILCLGVSVNTITLWHYYEDLLNVPYLGYYHPEERHLSYCTHGHRIQYLFPGIMDDVISYAGIMKKGKVGKGTSRLMRAREFNTFMATIFADNPFCMVLRPPDRTSSNLAVDALQKATAMLNAWQRGPQKAPEPFEPKEANPEFVREDCPAFIGYHETKGMSWPLCSANGRHPDLFRGGEIFNRNGLCCCSVCCWNDLFPPFG